MLAALASLLLSAPRRTSRARAGRRPPGRRGARARLGRRGASRRGDARRPAARVLPARGREWRALAALPIETAPRRGAGGDRGRRLAGEAKARGRGARLAGAARSPSCPRSSSSRRPTSPPRIAADRAAFAAAYARPFEPPLGSGAPSRGRGERDESGRFGDQRVLNGMKQSVHYGTRPDAARAARPSPRRTTARRARARRVPVRPHGRALAHGAGSSRSTSTSSRIEVRHGQTRPAAASGSAGSGRPAARPVRTCTGARAWAACSWIPSRSSRSTSRRDARRRARRAGPRPTRSGPGGRRARGAARPGRPPRCRARLRDRPPPSEAAALTPPTRGG